MQDAHRAVPSGVKNAFCGVIQKNEVDACNGAKEKH